ncbi:hypothetical protein SLS62_003132 [Diatrype stigma]|uniref:O-methyltransferase C-terminal domain-containing protein n=1 Tax=Diatrype stigma TaxID=117547 RepID=A0AAN9YQ40_9PEZI
MYTPIPKQEVSIAALAERISSSCSQIRDYLAASSLPEPTFVATAAGNGGGIPDTIEYEALRAPLNDALHDLLRLINGPVNTLTELVFSHYDLAALQIALDRRFFDHVPLPEAKERELSAKADTEKPKLSVAGIARKAGMDEDRTGRVLGLLATHRIFEEVGAEVGAGGSFFAHTASSAFLARNPDFHAVAEMQMDDMFRVAPEASAMISGNPFGSDPSQSVFHQRHGTSLYQYYEQRPEKARRFARAMSCWSQVNRHVDELYGFPWASLGNGTVVDVGGGNGHTSVELARFIVQDISPHMLSEADQDVGGRVTFQQHDFFNSQPVRQASAFVIRQCLHNYDDPDAARILRAVVPALEQCAARTPLLISDIIVPEPGTAARCQEHHLRQIDCCMMVLQGAKERTKGGFNKIIKEADERLQIISLRFRMGHQWAEDFEQENHNH